MAGGFIAAPVCVEPQPALKVRHEYRWAEGRYETLLSLAADLVKSRVDVIVCVGDPVTLAAKQASSAIPIVMASVGDPLGRGFVTSLARPGGNIPPALLARAEVLE